MYMLLTFASTHLNGHFQILFVAMATSRSHSIIIEKSGHFTISAVLLEVILQTCLVNCSLHFI